MKPTVIDMLKPESGPPGKSARRQSSESGKPGFANVFSREVSRHEKPSLNDEAARTGRGSKTADDQDDEQTTEHYPCSRIPDLLLLLNQSGQQISQSETANITAGQNHAAGYHTRQEVLISATAAFDAANAAIGSNSAMISDDNAQQQANPELLADRQLPLSQMLPETNPHEKTSADIKATQLLQADSLDGQAANADAELQMASGASEDAIRTDSIAQNRPKLSQAQTEPTTTSSRQSESGQPAAVTAAGPLSDESAGQMLDSDQTGDQEQNQSGREIDASSLLHTKNAANTDQQQSTSVSTESGMTESVSQSAAINTVSANIQNNAAAVVDASQIYSGYELAVAEASSETDAVTLSGQAVAAMATLTRGGQQEIRVRLFPDQFGEMQVKLVRQGDSLSAKIAADTLATCRMIESGLPQLQQALAEKQIICREIQVLYQPAEQDPTDHSFSQADQDQMAGQTDSNQSDPRFTDSRGASTVQRTDRQDRQADGKDTAASSQHSIQPLSTGKIDQVV